MTMNAETRKRYIRLIYARALRSFGGALVAAALVSGLCQQRIYFVFACCAFGFAFFCCAWFSYLRQTGLRLFGFRPNRAARKVPYFHLRDKGQRLHRPSFAQDNIDFDDDLVSRVSTDVSVFDEKYRARAPMFARALCGALLVLVSAVVS